jgi:hypothetical protein
MGGAQILMNKDCQPGMKETEEGPLSAPCAGIVITVESEEGAPLKH